MLNQPRADSADSGVTALDDQSHAKTRILQDAVDVQRGGGKILPSDDDARGALVACEWCTDGALREDAFGFSIRHLPSFNKGAPPDIIIRCDLNNSQKFYPTGIIVNVNVKRYPQIKSVYPC
jgi:hypothetical protein